jgi:hypothetical protein
MALTPNNGWDLPDDSDPFKDGALAIRNLGNAIDTSVGNGLLAWTTWAPTLSGGWANGNGTWSARYAQIGKTVLVYGSFTLGSTTTKGTNMLVSLPVTAVANSTFATWNCFTSVAGGTSFACVARLESTTSLRILAQNAAGTYLTVAQITSAIPATWATGDSIAFQLVYQAA